MEAWLKTNRRALWIGTLPPTIVAAIGAWLAFASAAATNGWLRALGAAMMIVALGLIAVLLLQLRQPRIAFSDGRVLFFLRSGPPIAVPVEFVEAFFLGQGPLMLPGPQRREESTVNLVARISQRATEWNQQDVKPALARWCDSYVTIRGTWCEPLHGELIRRLNRRLREATDESKSR